jgi:prophage regulatory protein
MELYRMNQLIHPQKLPETGYLRLPDVLYFFPISKSAWWAGIKSGLYPPGVKLSKRITAWRAEDIRALIQRGIAA